MKAAPLLVAWHNDSAPIYSAHFEPHGKGRLATGAGDTNVRLWKVEQNGNDKKVTYLSTLAKHTQAVNVVRWCPRGEMLASAGDDANVLLWVPTDHQSQAGLGEDRSEDKETWMVKRMCRASGNEIYDLAWSPDGNFFVTGSMDNVARIFDAQTGVIVRQIAEHQHFVQGVAWDPLNEYLATQSSDRSVHVYTLRTNDGQFSLSQHGRMHRMDQPSRRRTSNSPAPPDFSHRSRLTSDASSNPAASPAPSAPGTPASSALPMPPPPASSSRRSSFGNSSPAIRRSASPAPSMPLPAIMPSASPRPHALFAKNANLYHNETLTSFFRRLTFAPDGSLLFTPAGQYKTSHQSLSDPSRVVDEVSNTVYIYGRGGLNKPPLAHLPGHKKPSISVRCSPVLYNLRLPLPTNQITIDTSAGSEDIPPLPEPAVPSKPPTSASSMDPPGPTSAASPPPRSHATSPRLSQPDANAPAFGPQPAFALPYRVVYAVATQDAVYIYDTQQQTPLCVVNNLHYATFTDLAWSNDGNVLLITSSDGFCSALSFSSGELGTIYHGSLHARLNPPSALHSPHPTSARSSPTPTPTITTHTNPATVQSQPKVPTPLASGFPAPTPSPSSAARPASPTRSESASSTTSSYPPQQQPTPVTTGSGTSSQAGAVISNPTPAFSNLPSVAATNSGTCVPAVVPKQLTSPTPPMTPAPGESIGPADADKRLKRGAEQASVGKGGTDDADQREPKKRRMAPTPVTDSDSGGGGPA